MQLAVSDIDGTLAEIGEPISEANLRAIERLQASGVQVVLASGRHHDNMIPFCRQLNGVQWLVSAQGAMVANLDKSQVVYLGFMESAAVSELIDLGEHNGYTTLVYTSDGVVTPHTGEWVHFYEKTAVNLVQGMSKTEVLSRNCFKVVWAGDPAAIARAGEVSPKKEALIQFQTHTNLYEFMPCATSKGNAVRRLCEHLGIPLEQVLALGDGTNDVSMLEIAGHSIAMGHGSAEAIRSAKLVASEGDPREALARGIEAWFEKIK